MADIEKIKEELDKVRPSLQADGGDVELVEYKDNIVYVKLKGTCNGCPFSKLTIKMGIEQALKQAIPEIVAVEEI